jgi:phosphatidylglycerol:prolipoprotein diacylglycerol transferase
MGRYPVPLMESCVEGLLCIWLMRLRLHKRFNGQVMLHYVMIYPAARFVLEMFRGDAVRGYVVKLDVPGINAALGLDPSVPVMLTTSQFISILVVVASIVLIFVGKRAAAGGPIVEAAWWEQPDPAAAVAQEQEEEEDEGEEEEEDEDGTGTEPSTDPPRKDA